MARSKAGSVELLNQTALGLPGVTTDWSSDERPIYQVSRKSFVFFRTPRKDAVDPETGELLDDVIVMWCSQEDKTALLSVPGTPLFTTDHFNGHPSVLVRQSRLPELAADELVELVQDAWISRAPKRAVQAWLSERGLAG